MNRKVILGASIGGGALIIVMVLSVFLYKSPVSITRANKVSSVVSAAAAYTSSSFVYINNKEIVQFDYTNGTTTILSPGEYQDGLANSDNVSVSPDRHYILFHSSLASNGILQEVLTQEGLNTQSDYWWIFNTQNKTFQPIPQEGLVAKFDNDSVDVLGQNNGSEFITTYDAGTIKTTKTTHITNSSNFFVVKNGFLLQTASNDVLYTQDGVVNSVILKGAVVVGVSADRTKMLAVSGQNIVHTLVAVTLADNKSTTVAQNVIGQQALLDSGIVLYSTGSPASNINLVNFYSYDINSDTNKPWNLPANLAAPANPPLTAALLLGNETAAISDSSGNYFLIGSKLATKTDL